MEQRVRDISTKHLSPQILCSLRSLIINPDTSDSTISIIFETLTGSLHLSRDALVLHQVLKLLNDLSSCHPDLSSVIFDLISSTTLWAESTRLSVESLAVLVSISERNSSLVSALESISDQFFLSLCFGQPLSARVWLLRNVERFHLRPYLLFTVFLGFTKDPYPHVRKAALDGLVCLCKPGDFHNIDVAEGCYRRAVELLRDTEFCVRSAAVRAVSEWGHVLVASSHEGKRREWSDAMFIQLCAMVRDMSMKVRVEAFNALGKTDIASEDVLLQALSKKVLGVRKEKIAHACTADSFEISAASAAGAFVHGLEDEFHEVRESACKSLRTLSVLCSKFAAEALNLLMDLLNDDSMVVRSQALETMHHMLTCGHLKMHEMHLHTFLGALVDSSADIRSAVRKIVKLVKLPDVVLFKQSIDGLLEGLEMYPQDESDIFSVLFHIGQSHKNFAVSIIKKIAQEINLDSKDKLDLDSARLAAFIVLAISVPLSDKENISCIPPKIFFISLTMLGRISRALSDVMNQNTVLAYLSQCIRLCSSSGLECAGKKLLLDECEQASASSMSIEISSLVERSLQQTIDGAFEIQSQSCYKPHEKAISHVEAHLEEIDEVRKHVNIIFAKIKAVWLLVQSGCTNGAMRALRACKVEISTFNTECLESAGALAFTLEYLRVMKLLAMVWEHFVPTRKLYSYEIGELELLLGKLDRELREIRCRFIGHSKEEVLHVLELVLLTCLLRLSKVEICCYQTTMKKLFSSVSCAEFLQKEGRIQPSIFFIEIKKSLHEIGSTVGSPSCLFLLKKLLSCFSPEQFVLCESPRHINAKLEVPGNNSENPLPFVSGLPVAIPFEITLHNISREDRLWLRITMNDESTQFSFLDLAITKSSEDIRKFTYTIPVYLTPQAVSFTLMVSIGMECLFEDAYLVKHLGGPKHELIHLCQEKEVYLSTVFKD